MNKPLTRTEHDSMGELQVPVNALYQAQTQRAVNNFTISTLTMPFAFINALAIIKLAAAKSNYQLSLLPEETCKSIEFACQEILSGTYYEHFPVNVFQTGSGTSSNMNANEVIATLASQQLGRTVHPNDDVNMGQSSNDVIPTAIQVSAVLALKHQLFPATTQLKQQLTQKISEIGAIIKTGRTHLMDAMPVSFAQTLGAWLTQIEHAEQGINQTFTLLTKLAQGGTAVGSGINAHPSFASTFNQHISAITEVNFTPSDNFFYNIGSQDALVALSGQLKVLAVALTKIANDLRWMNSGPLAGLAEISLPALQPGSSIMPGKVNPVIPEAVAMACAQVIGNDTTLTVAGQSGNFELNVMLPVIAYNMLQSIELLSDSCESLAHQAIAGFTVNEDKINQALSRNPILVTALNPIIGYEKAASIAKQAYQTGQAIIDVAEQHTDLSREALTTLLNPTQLSQGGIQQN